jgi:hypothetical protein
LRRWWRAPARRASATRPARRDPPIELQFSMPDAWSRQLFVSLCRRYGLQPYRYSRQKRTTVMVRVPRGFNDTVLWPEFLELDRALSAHLQSVTTRIIHDAIHADTSEVEEVQTSLPGV